MRKLNLTIATLALVAFTTILLSSCHRNTCPTFGQATDTCTQEKI